MQYIQLLHKGRCPYNLKEVKQYSEKQKRWLSSKYDYTVRNNMYELSIYSKQKQMQENRLGDEEEQALAEGQIRIEFRAFRSKIRYEKNVWEMEDDEKMLSNASMIAYYEIRKLLFLMYGIGDFVKKDEVLRKIENASFHPETKESMIHFCELSNRKYGMDLAYKSYSNRTSNGARMKMRFDKIGISPICIPRNSNFNRMKSPLFYIHYNTVNEREYKKYILL